jgi:hypothetical protein
VVPVSCGSWVSIGLPFAGPMLIGIVWRPGNVWCLARRSEVRILAMTP